MNTIVYCFCCKGNQKSKISDKIARIGNFFFPFYGYNKIMTGTLLNKNIRYKDKKNRDSMARIWRFRQMYIMLIPALIYYVIFKYYPMYGVTLAFKDYDFIGGIIHSPWAKPLLKHFNLFFKSPYFNVLMSNTLLISLYKLAAGIIPPVLLAVLITECRKKTLREFVQSVTFIPHFLSWIIMYGIMIALLSQTTGLFNRWLTELTGKSIAFFTSTKWFRALLVVSEIWKSSGFSAIIYIAAINGIDLSLFEAARIDGASRIQIIRRITLPSIMPVMVMLLILKLGHVLDAGFEQIFIMYNIQVYAVADIIDTWVYRTGLQQLNFSLASAVGLFKSLIACILVVSTNLFAKRFDKGIW
jgi:putative aldouronate transport system permease protein